jgi:ABC-type glycerol-3-phosphate transport system substrate-binding protein
MMRLPAGAAAALAVGLLLGACGGSSGPTAATVSNSQTWTWNGEAWQQRGGL